MKIVANRLVISRSEWERIGRAHGWLRNAATTEELWRELGRLRRDYHISSPLQKPAILKRIKWYESLLDVEEGELGDIRLYPGGYGVNPDVLGESAIDGDVTFFWCIESETLLTTSGKDWHLDFLRRLGREGLPWDMEAAYESFLEENGFEDGENAWEHFTFQVAMHEIEGFVSGRALQDGKVALWDSMPPSSVLSDIVAALPFKVREIWSTKA